MRMGYNKASLWSGIGFALCLQCANADSSIPFTVLWTAYQGPATPTYQAITTREQWVQFWKQLRVDSERFLHGPTPRTDEAPEFDFKQVTLIVAGAGTKPMSGYSIAIQRIWDDSVNIRVSVLETSPGRNCAGTAMSVAPFVGASIPATTRKVVFDISRAETVCN
jgi:hypothetical protein